MWLQVRDVYATEEELKGRGVEIAREATQEPWGLHEMHVVDPDGVTADLRPGAREPPVAARHQTLTAPGCRAEGRQTEMVQRAGDASGHPTEASRDATWWISSGFGSFSITACTAVRISSSVTVSESLRPSGSTGPP